MHEGMARYQYVYGFKPIGPHRGMTDQLLGALRRTCERCGGAGIVSLDRDRWRGCVECEGTGGFWTRPPEEVERVRDRVRARHPDAAVANPTARFIGGALAHYTKTGEMVDLLEERKKEKELVFQWWGGDEGVLLRRSDWEWLTSIERALRESGTWGELREALPAGEFESLHLWESNGGDLIYRDGDRFLFAAGQPVADRDDLPDDYVISSADPFTPYDIPAVPDGDYPPWIREIEGLTLPRSFVEAFGHRVHSRLNGSWTQYAMERRDEIVEALEERGFYVKVVTESES
jgi:hypothetical protein